MAAGKLLGALPFVPFLRISKWHRCSNRMSSSSKQQMPLTFSTSATGAPSPGTAAAPLAGHPLEMERRIPGLMRWVDFCNNGAAAAAAGDFAPLKVDGKAVGYLKPRWDHRNGKASTPSTL